MVSAGARSYLLDVHDTRQEGGRGQLRDDGLHHQLLLLLLPCTSWLRLLWPPFPVLLPHQVAPQEAVRGAEVPDESLCG